MCKNVTRAHQKIVMWWCIIHVSSHDGPYFDAISLKEWILMKRSRPKMIRPSNISHLLFDWMMVVDSGTDFTDLILHLMNFAAWFSSPHPRQNKCFHAFDFNSSSGVIWCGFGLGDFSLLWNMPFNDLHVDSNLSLFRCCLSAFIAVFIRSSLTMPISLDAFTIEVIETSQLSIKMLWRTDTGIFIWHWSRLELLRTFSYSSMENSWWSSA